MADEQRMEVPTLRPLASRAGSGLVTTAARVSLATGSLLIGGWLYVAFRTEHLLMFRWFRLLRLESAVVRLRLAAAPYRGAVPDVVLFCLPNALWLYAYGVTLSLVWGARRAGLHWLFALYGVAVLSELLQLAGGVRGTFDWRDLVAYTGAALLSARWMKEGR